MAIDVRMDDKGRLSIPRAAREQLGWKGGDVFFLEQEADGTVRLARAENPFDVLARDAARQYRAGKTINVREYAASHGVDLDDDTEDMSP
ncbi:MAG: AbrB family transcriptional regulator [Chloroflexota bacterium]|nr:AbrB family transcriptional regulator [Chloroflexota bacterium]